MITIHEEKLTPDHEEKLTPEEYIDFLKRTDPGSQYPKERFAERIPRLLENASISLAARNEVPLRSVG